MKSRSANWQSSSIAEAIRACCKWLFDNRIRRLFRSYGATAAAGKLASRKVLVFMRFRGHKDSYSRAPHGARGLKLPKRTLPWYRSSRAPHGARGLKRDCIRHRLQSLLSRPARGAWIETHPPGPDRPAACRAPHGARGLKHRGQRHRIEPAVAPRTGRVD